MGNHRVISIVLLGALLWAFPGHFAAADHDDGVYELPAYANWDHGDLSVLVVPPIHGQLWNPDAGFLNGQDPDELTPFNSYLIAIESAIDAWDEAVELLGADWLGIVYEPTVYVLGRDTVPPEVMTSPDILVVTDENEGPSLGTSIWAKTGHVRTPCVVRMSLSEIGSFSYADMYNVTMQEFGHCLGLQHVGSQGGVDPTSEAKHPEHDAMNGFYTHFIGEEGTHLHCVSNLDVKALEHVFDYEMPYSAVLNLGAQGITYMPVQAYGDTCELPTAEWRMMTPPTMIPAGPDMRSTIEKPVEGSSLQPRSLRRVTGSVHVEAALEEEGYGLQVGLALIGEDGSCQWWDDELVGFVQRDCYSPVWAAADIGDEAWKWKTPKGLTAGAYRVVSRVTSLYANEPLDAENTAEFTLAERSVRPGR